MRIIYQFKKQLENNNNDDTSSVKVSEFSNSQSIYSFIYEDWIDYYFILLGYIIGYGSFWRFPYLIYSNGGMTFIIIFTFLLFAIGIPFFYLETFLGQLYHSGPVEVFKKINNKFMGIGWGMVTVCFFLSLYYTSLIIWSFYFLFGSFMNPLPWTQFKEGSGFEPKFDYFINEVLKFHDDHNGLGSFDIYKFLCLIATYISIFFSIKYGIASSSKVVYITTPAPFIFGAALYYKGISLDGAWDGISYLMIPSLKKLFDLSIWVNAGNQVIFILSLGIGPTIFLSKYRKKKETIENSSIIIPICSLVFGILSAFISFSILGSLSKFKNSSIESLPLHGSELGFISFPITISYLPYANLWSILFFIMLVTIGIGSEIILCEMISYYLYNYYLKEKGYSKQKSSLIVCLVGFIFGLLFTFDKGYIIFQLFDQNVTYLSCFVIILLENYVCIYHIGEESLNKKAIQTSGKPIPGLILKSLKYFCPYACLVFIVDVIYKLIFEKISNHEYLSIYKLIEIILIFLPSLIILYFYIIYRNENFIGDDIKQELNQERKEGEENELDISSKEITFDNIKDKN